MSEDSCPSKFTAEMLQQYLKDGYTVIPDFLSDEEIESLEKATAGLVEELDPAQHPAVTFSTTDTVQSRSEYFLNSGDKIRYFFEEDSLDENGKLKVPKELALNKIGHALHWLVPEFREVSFSDKVKDVARQLKFHSPAVVQSMFIFKQPGFGGEVTPHKDSTFLQTSPQSCVGLWFALQDATLENGCLWFSPGTQNTGTKRRFVRTFDETGHLTTRFTADPEQDDPSSYVAAPVKKGSLVIIHGSVSHKSERNTSDKSRHAYTFHIIERRNTTWEPDNWLQPTPKMPFTGLYENQPRKQD